ncbi:MAG: hypothetical protein ACRC2S_02370 [Waterburya sp.]
MKVFLTGVSSDKAKRELGWLPKENSLLEEIASGAYVRTLS